MLFFSLPQVASTLLSLPTDIREAVHRLLRDECYQHLAGLATQPVKVMSDDYVGYFSDADPNHQRSTLARIITKSNIERDTVLLKDLFGLAEWNGVPLERVLRRENVDPKRLRGCAQTHILSGTDMLVLILQAPKGRRFLPGLIGAERAAHTTLTHAVTSTEADFTASHSADAGPQFQRAKGVATPNWRLYSDGKWFVDTNQKRACRAKIFTDNGFRVVAEVGSITNKTLPYDALVRALKKAGAIQREVLQLSRRNKHVFCLRPGTAFPLHASAFDLATWKWVKGVFSAIKGCTGRHQVRCSEEYSNILVMHAVSLQTSSTSEEAVPVAPAAPSPPPMLPTLPPNAAVASSPRPVSEEITALLLDMAREEEIAATAASPKKRRAKVIYLR